MKIIPILMLFLISCGDELAATMDTDETNSGYDGYISRSSDNDDNETSDIIRISNWKLNEKVLNSDFVVSSEYCISWDFEPVKYISIPSNGRFILSNGSTEEIFLYGYIYNCSDDLKTYKLYFEEKDTKRKFLISVVQRVDSEEESETGSSSTNTASNYPSTRYSPTPTPTPTAKSTPTPTSATVVFSLFKGFIKWTKYCREGTGTYCRGECRIDDRTTRDTWESEIKFTKFAEVQSYYQCTLTLVGGKYYCDIANSRDPFKNCRLDEYTYGCYVNGSTYETTYVKGGYCYGYVRGFN